MGCCCRGGVLRYSGMYIIKDGTFHMIGNPQLEHKNIWTGFYLHHWANMQQFCVFYQFRTLSALMWFSKLDTTNYPRQAPKTFWGLVKEASLWLAQQLKSNKTKLTTYNYMRHALWTGIKSLRLREVRMAPARLDPESVNNQSQFYFLDIPIGLPYIDWRRYRPSA